MKKTYIQPQLFIMNIHPATIVCGSSVVPAPRVSGSILLYTDKSGDAGSAF